ncbi:MAG: tRNA pseudouridine(55) synthase TruB [Simkania sp.]|nr:tRNA pseudouridine(55) synthase TruB [Simkania sp.]
MPEGILVIDKLPGKTSFSLVSLLRHLSGQRTIGHAGTLDPFATGLMVLLIGSRFTRLSDKFLQDDKEYLGTIHLGIETDSYDCDGKIISQSELIPTIDQIEQALKNFQGTVLQTPPMFSAKKIDGQKLYHLARQGKVIERKAVPVQMHTELLAYEYPYVRIKVVCSKGTYVRSIAHDLGKLLNTGAHLSSLRRIRSGSFRIEQAVSQAALEERTTVWHESLINVL